MEARRAARRAGTRGSSAGSTGRRAMAWLAHASLLVFPSYGPESLSRVLLEAAAIGRAHRRDEHGRHRGHRRARGDGAAVGDAGRNWATTWRGSWRIARWPTRWRGAHARMSRRTSTRRSSSGAWWSSTRTSSRAGDPMRERARPRRRAPPGRADARDRAPSRCRRARTIDARPRRAPPGSRRAHHAADEAADAARRSGPGRDLSFRFVPVRDVPASRAGAARRSSIGPPRIPCSGSGWAARPPASPPPATSISCTASARARSATRGRGGARRARPCRSC